MWYWYMYEYEANNAKKKEKKNIDGHQSNLQKTTMCQVGLSVPTMEYTSFSTDIIPVPNK